MSEFSESNLEDWDALSMDEQDLLEPNSELSSLKMEQNVDIDDYILENASKFLFAEDLVTYISHEFHFISYEVKIKEGREFLYNAFNEAVKFAVDFIRLKILKVHYPLIKLFGELCKYNELYFQRFVKGILGHYSCEDFNPGIFLYLCVYITELASECYNPHFPEVLDGAVYAILDAISVLNKEWKNIDTVAELLIFPLIEDYDNPVYERPTHIHDQTLSKQDADIEETIFNVSINDSKPIQTLCVEVEEKLKASNCVNESDVIGKSLSTKDGYTESIKELCVDVKDLKVNGIKDQVICNSLSTVAESTEDIKKLCVEMKELKASNGVNEVICNSLLAKDQSTEDIKKICVDVKDLKAVNGVNEVTCNSLLTKDESTEYIRKLCVEMKDLKAPNGVNESDVMGNSLLTKDQNTEDIKKLCVDLKDLKAGNGVNEEVICNFLSTKDESTEDVKKLCVEMRDLKTSNGVNEVICNSLSTKTESTEPFERLCAEMEDLKPFNGVNEVICNSVSTKNKSAETIKKFHEMEDFKASYATNENEDLNELSKRKKNMQRIKNITLDLEKLKLSTEQNKYACISYDSMSPKKEIVQIVRKMFAELENFQEFKETDRLTDIDLVSKTKKDTQTIQNLWIEMDELKVVNETSDSEVICNLSSTKTENEEKEKSHKSVDNGDDIVSLSKNCDRTDSSNNFCQQNYKSSNNVSKMNEDLLKEVMSIVHSEVSMFLSEFLSSYSHTISDSCADSQSHNEKCTELNDNLKLLNIESKDSEVMQDQLVHTNPGFIGKVEAILTDPVDIYQQQNDEKSVDSSDGIINDSNNCEKIGNKLQGIFHALCEKECNDEHLILLNGDTLLFAEDLVGYIFQEFYGIPYDESTCNEHRNILNCEFTETIKQAVHFIHLDMVNLASSVFEYIEHLDKFRADCYKKVVSSVLSCYSHAGLNSEEFLYQCVFFVALASRYYTSDSAETSNFVLNAIMDAFCMLTEDWNGLNDAAAKILKISKEFCMYRSCKAPSYDQNLNLSYEDCDVVAVNYLKENGKIINEIRKYVCKLKGCEIENEKCMGNFCNPFFKFDENATQSIPEENNNSENVSLEKIDDMVSFAQTEQKSKEPETLTDPLRNDEVKALLALSLEVKSVIYKALVINSTYAFQT